MPAIALFLHHLSDLKNVTKAFVIPHGSGADIEQAVIGCVGQCMTS